jgi:hypothetical protein
MGKKKRSRTDYNAHKEKERERYREYYSLHSDSEKERVKRAVESKKLNLNQIHKEFKC